MPFFKYRIKINNFACISGDDTILSKHCAIDSPVVGKRYMYHNGREVESSVKIDPFKTIERRKRSPDFFGRVPIFDILSWIFSD